MSTYVRLIGTTMAAHTQIDPEIQYLKQLSEADLSDVLTLRRDTAENVLTEKRVELLRTIERQDVSSIRDLARQVDRDVSIVSRDLDLLFEADVIEFERDGNAKRPKLAHENVFVTPVVFDSRVLDE